MQDLFYGCAAGLSGVSVTGCMTDGIITSLLEWNPQLLTIHDLVTCAAVCKTTQAVLRRQQLVNKYYRCYLLLKLLLRTRVLSNMRDTLPVSVTREYELEEWQPLVHPFYGTLTAQQWAVYYSYWCYWASVSASHRPVHWVNGKLEKVVILLLYGNGFVKQLPNSNGTVSVKWGGDGFQLCVVYHNNEMVRATTTGMLWPNYEDARNTLVCDWKLFQESFRPMRVLQKQLAAGVDSEDVVITRFLYNMF